MILRLKNKDFLTLLLILFMVGGCATVPPKFPYETVSIHNVSYFALSTMCDREGIKWDYDPLSRAVILKSQGKDFKLLIGSPRMMEGDIFHELSGPIEIRNSVIYAPVDLRSYLILPPCPIPQKIPPPGSAYLRPVTTVTIDAGHGGRDPGAIGKYGLREKKVVLDVAEKVRDELEHCGLKVYMTRSSDEFLQLQERPQIANAKKADLFVSIHANANRSRWIEGFEVYYLTEAVDDNARALAAAENADLDIEKQGLRDQFLSLKAMIWDMIYTENRKESIELAKTISQTVSKKMNLKLLGVKGAPFAVLKGAAMPAVLVEIGYISNGEGEKRLQDPEYRRKMAEAIASGILDFKNYSEGGK